MTRDNTRLQEHISKFIDAKLLLRLMTIVAIVEFVSLALGIAFFLIVHGLIFGALWFVLYWEPAYRIYALLLQIPQAQFKKAPLPWWRAILLGAHVLVVLAFLYFGIRTIATSGFWDQNLIYTIFASSR